MEILRLLESIRTPFGDLFFSAITHLGEETLLILIGLLFFWCLDKRRGYYILTVGFLGTVLNQFLKLTFRIPRPWVRDPDFTIVESARAEATGYSFPSGHTQTAVGVFGCIARSEKKRWPQILCLLACILVPLSRMYLGVHTPADVLVSLAVALLLVLVLYPAVMKSMERPGGLRPVLAILSVLSLAFLLYAHLWPFPADIDADNLASGMKNAWKILGCLQGLWIAYEMDQRYLQFDTKAIWWAQILKLILGLIPLLLIKSLLKEPLYQLFDGSYLADGVRYLLIVIFAGCIWPLTFPWFAGLGQKK